MTNIKVIESQIKLAKSHGIYGFGIYFYWFSGKKLLDKPLNIFIKNTNINFRFLLIWANENWTKRWDGRDKEIIIKQEYKPNDAILFIKDIKKYIIDKRYIRIEEKPIIGIYEPNKIPNLRKTIQIWRKKSRELAIGEIFILICINSNKTEDFQNLDLFNASYEFPPRNSLKDNHRILKNETLIYFYPELIYKSLYFNDTLINLSKMPFFRGIMLEWDNCPRMKKCVLFNNYSPEHFYIYNKIIVDWTQKHFKKDFRFIFINGWNEWGEGSYLEPDNKYGYASINSFSKAIYNISYTENVRFDCKYRIAIIAHIYIEDSIKEIINKIYNIPYPFDLFIFSVHIINMDIYKNYIKNNSNINNFEFKLFFNKRKSLLAFFSDFKNKSKIYKYICNINFVTYKNINYFEEWKIYLHNNLLGNSRIVSEIIADFENNNKLGLIFPEKYYKSLIHFSDDINNLDLKYLNFILKKIYCLNLNINISEEFFDFPEGNMFWAKVSAIYPIFDLYSNAAATKNFNLILNNNLEKIWVYLTKFNGFLYKKIYKHF